jgi:hypothetical protein
LIDEIVSVSNPTGGDLIIIPFNRPRRYCPLWVAVGWMDGRNVFIKNGAAAKKDWEIIKGVKEEWPLLANNERAARAQFEMIEERDASYDIKQNSTTAAPLLAVQQQLLLGGVVCVCMCGKLDHKTDCAAPPLSFRFGPNAN